MFLNALKWWNTQPDVQPQSVKLINGFHCYRWVQSILHNNKNKLHNRIITLLVQQMHMYK